MRAAARYLLGTCDGMGREIERWNRSVAWFVAHPREALREVDAGSWAYGFAAFFGVLSVTLLASALSH